ncbi:protocatechuate 3,4-dioxygenase subunit beta [Mycolicibacterium neoaurum]|uniref:protocatechuate 3,4-dioxygenase subunit beta n=1 Tax=Mycolicibacterium neoaurum TaxID=1795 RepID=UPI001BCE0CFC|nr:protocatechuate 3,4-dioxygenase subunit beta [Mycolicibacterium neoaurum]QVI27264.1 protocatechuate 3,4-dioxygenase subunit beta [Mycolicibacterium neoaurum]
MTALADATALAPQHEIDAEIDAYVQSSARPQPQLNYPPYRSSLLRHPSHPLQVTDPHDLELSVPVFGTRDVSALDSDLTIGHAGEPIGERILITGRVTDSRGRPIAGQLVEIWQANAAGRYIHKRDQHPAPLDPNFTGAGRCITAADGTYRFQTIKPGPYPWRNHLNAWRPAHVHFSLFGRQFTERLVTQMYFPGDPLFSLDPIYQAITDAGARDRLVAVYDHSITQHEYATGYRFDIVLDGSRRTPTDEDTHG